eukprot:8020343-Karenia_brevis.AAC.1
MDQEAYPLQSSQNEYVFAQHMYNAAHGPIYEAAVFVEVARQTNTHANGKDHATSSCIGVGRHAVLFASRESFWEVCGNASIIDGCRCGVRHC